MTPPELASNDVATVRALLGSVMNLMVAVAYVVGTLVIGLTLYASVFEQIRSFGIVKALGARNAHLYAYVLAQAGVFSITGFGLGIALSLGVAWLVSWLAPQYLVVPLDAQVLARSALAAFVMATTASLLPIRQVAEVDPVMVFRS